MNTKHESFFSAAAADMKESAIRRMGALQAAARDMISFAPGYPAPDTFPWDEFSQIAAELLASREPGVLQYGPTRGYRPLLETITAIMAHRGMPTRLEDLLVTTGSQQGLDLVARVLIDPGDVILVELPTYVGAISAFRNLQASLVGVPQEADGIDLAALDATYETVRRDGRRVKFLYVVPNFQNPTGLLIGVDKRQRLLEWAERRDVLIVEDDPYRELYFEDSATEADVRPLKADDADGRVIYLSSFSKTLAPGFRVAWIAAAPALTAKFEMAKQAGDLLTGSLDQRFIYEACRRGVLERQLPMLRAHYARKRDVMEAALGRELGASVTWPKPKGGFFLWLTLPPEIDADAMIPRAVEHGVIYVAGEAFYVNALRGLQGTPSEQRESRGGEGHNTLRLSFSAPTPERIDAGVARLALTLRGESAARATAGAAAGPAAS
jgi:2-aminoadipate transaminase